MTTRANRTWRAAAAASALSVAAVFAGAQSCSSVTEVVVVVDGDVASIDTITVRIEGAAGLVEEKSARPGVDAELPLTLGVQAGDDESGSFVVRASAKRGSEVVVSRVVRARLVPGESRVLVVSLCAACDGVACDGDTTCGAGGMCEPVRAPELPRWTGAPPPHACGGSRVDAGLEASVLDGGYHELDDPRLWSAVDLGATVDPGLRGYAGAAVDDRFLYLAPWASGGVHHGRIARFDTTKPFEAKDSWSWIDLSSMNPNAKGYCGAAVFKNEYLYFVPFQSAADRSGDVVARYTVGGDFADRGAWDFVALSTHGATLGAGGFGGAVVNYSHVWLPTRDPSRPFALHENRADQNPGRLLDAGWQSFDPRSVDAGAQVPGGYYGGAFDGDTLYFAPHEGASGPHGVALAKDVGGGLERGWRAFDLTTLSDAYRGYAGAVFAASHVYFVPHANAAGRHGSVVRLDTKAPFEAATSWSAMDISAIDPALAGFVGGVFDGRFVYFVPFASSGPLLVARYDTKAPFGERGSWSAYDVRSIAGEGTRYNGGAFDGKYVYFVPYDGGPVLRFDARHERDTSVRTANGSFL